MKILKFYRTDPEVLKYYKKDLRTRNFRQSHQIHTKLPNQPESAVSTRRPTKMQDYVACKTALIDKNSSHPVTTQ